MALKVKAAEKNIKFKKGEPGVWRYVMQPELYTSLAQDKVIREAALRSGVSRGAADEEGPRPDGPRVPRPDPGVQHLGHHLRPERRLRRHRQEAERQHQLRAHPRHGSHRDRNLPRPLQRRGY